jgi:hypothetical protein
MNEGLLNQKNLTVAQQINGKAPFFLKTPGIK